MVESYITNIFKDFGISEETEFAPEVFFPLYTKYNKLQELGTEQANLTNLENQLVYPKSRVEKLNTDILVAVDEAKTSLETELAGVVVQITSLETQITDAKAIIEALKTEMGMI